MAKKLEHFTFDDIPASSKYMIENFIVSDGTPKKAISLVHPFMFAGMVFCVCLKGTGRLEINYKEYTIIENSIVTIPPNQIVQVMNQSDDFLIELLAFSPDYLIDMALPKDFGIPEKIIASPVLNITEAEAQELLKYHAFIVTAFNGKKHPLFKQVIKGLLYSLLMEIAAKYIENETVVKVSSNRGEEIVKQFFRLLKEHHRHERAGAFYADKLCITTKYLSGTLKKVTGRSINSWLETAIIMSSKVLLKSSDLTVLQISEDLNFPNPSYFGRFFKKHTGMTPKEYRDKE